MQISQLINNSNNPQPHTSIIELNNGIKLLTHYKTTVAAYVPNKGYIRSSKFHSSTTSKVINMWMGKGGAEVEQDYLNRLLNGV